MVTRAIWGEPFEEIRLGKSVLGDPSREIRLGRFIWGDPFVADPVQVSANVSLRFLAKIEFLQL